MKKILAVLLAISLVVSLSACGKSDEELLGLNSDKPAQGNSGNTDDSIMPSGSVQLGREDDGTAVTGAVQAPQKTIEEMAAEAGDAWDPQPEYYSSLEEIPEDTYCIEHQEADGTMRYYLPYATYSSGFDVRDYPSKDNPERFVWVKADIDEGFIPTMYSTDRLIYKSSNNFPDRYAIERFYDGGYTFGLANLVKDAGGHYQYQRGVTWIEPSSDAVGFATLGAERVTFASVGGTPVDESLIAPGGYITGLLPLTDYKCDVRVGTESVLPEPVFRTDIHIWTSFETYFVNKFDFGDVHTIKLEHNPGLMTGYYVVNNCGLIRYVSASDEAAYSSGAEIDYNVPYFLYDSEGTFISTVEGYAICFDGEPTEIGTIIRDENGSGGVFPGGDDTLKPKENKDGDSLN